MAQEWLSLADERIVVRREIDKTCGSEQCSGHLFRCSLRCHPKLRGRAARSTGDRCLFLWPVMPVDDDETTVRCE